ncbi:MULTISPECIES: cytosine permease [unclassified Pseudomonas]|uniref:purine-cytosine permease family protein n=1 Tax=unclassified Pseudomonas TaxID=196821 RepID=UPI000BD977FD|nr:MULTISPECIES: cytosine permease [unclassified Pseudomonas]PVZ20074.1 NCS1 family nucleobase:cation symporter-1 [Pseudomonas sp. URIL14HWK12:I12]PVZ27140.1 NCS1 family nucleobase:cation symporter-1 [Pseudomonas sp. URIL14HWK12:I10]PVZ38029.1 NCS1 family nucleobase:cation symporter-1 [Pseudomonas sp. URIL14HWK12:I11]SNZ04772.1 nucleobase:cation symporter-1, NCS1 family [Pseudomonas sp. URIL14HWK12:I9]
MSEQHSHALAIENHTVDHVPDRERHGRSRDLFTLWFSTNIAPLPIVSGAMVVQTFGLGLGSGLLAIALGHLLGGTVLALSSAQGPRLGIPQMVQGRGQFGRYGALGIVLITALIYLGFFISNSVLAGKSVHNLVPAVPLSAGIVLGALAATAIGVIGYRFIHILNRIGTWVMGAGLFAGFAMVLSGPLPADFFSRGGFNLAGFIATVSLGVVWQVSFSPYTSDYSRYLPREVGIGKPFWATYLGAVCGTVLSFAFGAVVALASAPDADAMAAVEQSTGVLGPVLMLLFLFNIISHNALNLYGAVLSLITVLQTFMARWVPSVRLKVVLSSLVLCGCCLVALGASADFISRFIGLILALLLVLVPWASINLVDFYLIKRGDYHIPSLFEADGGRYGRFDWHAIGAWFVGVVAQLPFANTSLFTGPYANLVPGADLSWVVGLLVTAPLYFWLGYRREERCARRNAVNWS